MYQACERPIDHETANVSPIQTFPRSVIYRLRTATRVLVQICASLFYCGPRDEDVAGSKLTDIYCLRLCAMQKCGRLPSHPVVSGGCE